MQTEQAEAGSKIADACLKDSVHQGHPMGCAAMPQFTIHGCVPFIIMSVKARPAQLTQGERPAPDGQRHDAAAQREQRLLLRLQLLRIRSLWRSRHMQRHGRRAGHQLPHLRKHSGLYCLILGSVQRQRMRNAGQSAPCAPSGAKEREVLQSQQQEPLAQLTCKQSYAII